MIVSVPLKLAAEVGVNVTDTVPCCWSLMLDGLMPAENAGLSDTTLKLVGKSLGVVLVTVNVIVALAPR
ncbi:MAG TPA: hypothetical protein VFA54_12970 [Bryobacterales bacterium]|nr:hypothetical protein [Bryobacterales bacterium]